MNRMLLDAHEVAADGTARLRGRRAAHIHDVLRAAPGDTVRIGKVNGPRGLGRVRSVHAGDVVLACVFDAVVPEVPAIDLLLALPRPKVLRRLLPQLSSIGIGRLFLTNAWRVEKNYFSTHLLEGSILRAALLEGVEQAGVDTRIPRVHVYRHLRRFLEDEMDDLVAADAGRLLAHPAADVRLGAWQPHRAPGPARAVLAVGPEGGWIESEVQLFRRHGFLPVALGPRILRSDTACIALMSMAHERLAAADGERRRAENHTAGRETS